jgi:transmembrane sensor
MNQEQYLLLFEKFLTGKASSEEVEQLMAHNDNFDLAKTAEDERTNEYKIIEKRILDKIDQQAKPANSMKIYISKWWPTMTAAVLMFTIAAFLWQQLLFNHHVKQPGQPIELVKVKDFAPGSDQAMLTLSNGKKIILGKVGNGTIIKQGNITITKQKNGVLAYAISAQTGKRNVAAVQMNTITTPLGGQYKIILPDGTEVWLNAASSLKFPATFSGRERNVELTGEAYFEVAKNKNMPFKVKFKGQEVEVLGTHFNISAYKDDPESRTTLIEGSVAISRNKIKEKLKPGQQAVSSDTDYPGFKIQQANIEEAMAWKNGLFLFHDANIKDIMTQAARWYDVEVVYRGNLEDKQYGGRVSRYKNISELLKNLELTGTIHFKIEGRRVTVMQ